MGIIARADKYGITSNGEGIVLSMFSKKCMESNEAKVLASLEAHLLRLVSFQDKLVVESDLVNAIS